MMIRALALTVAFAGLTSTHAANGPNLRRNMMSDAIDDAKHERLQMLALKMNESAQSSGHSNNVDFGAGAFEQQVHLASAHPFQAKPKGTKALKTHNHHNKGGVDMTAMEHFLGKISKEPQDTVENGEGGDRRKLQTLSDVCDFGDNEAAIRAGESPLFMEEPEQCQCGYSSNGANYLSVCAQENPVCVDFSSRTTDAFIQVSHHLFVPRNGLTPLFFQCVQYGDSDPQFPGQEVCVGIYTNLSFCAAIVGDEFCESCSLCAPFEQATVQMSCATTSGASSWSSTSISECSTADLDTSLGTPLEWLHPDTTLCGAGDEDEQQYVGEISEQCVNEFLAFSENPAIISENQAIGQQRQALAVEDYCTTSSSTNGSTKCELDYSEFAHDFPGACDSTNGVYFENDYIITCNEKATCTQALLFAIKNLPECAGSSCSSSGIGVLSQFFLKVAFLDPLEESGTLECTGFWEVDSALEL